MAEYRWPEMEQQSQTDPQLANWRYDEIKSVGDIAPYWAKHKPDAAALIDGERRRTYSELDERTNRIASQLLTLGVGPDTLVGYFGKNSIEFWELWLSTGKAGCGFAPFNWRCAVAELVQIVDGAKPKLVLVEAEFAETFAQVQAGCEANFAMLVFGNDGADFEKWLHQGDAAAPDITISGEETALVSFTSGTTGLPKGVPTVQRNFTWSFLCTALEPSLGWQDGDVMLMAMPNFHLGGNWLSLYALVNGQTLSIVPQFDPDLCIDAINRDRVSVAPMVPAAIQVLLDHPRASPEAFAALRSIIYFGSPIAATALDRARKEIGCGLIQIYGTTETNFLTVLRPEDHDLNDPAILASCGRALPLCSLRVVNGEGEVVPVGTVGEVEARTPMAFSGYLNRPDATAEAWHDGWYRTGDLGSLDAAGYLSIVDRAKDMIISGGENIYSAEVEGALGKLPGIRQCGVVGLPHEKWGEQVTAAVVVDPEAGLTEAAIIAHCRTLIAAYKTPKQVLFLEALPQTPTGKVQKAALRELLTQGGGNA